jgi:hypothetical protein
MSEQGIVATELGKYGAALFAMLQVNSDFAAFFRSELVVKVSTKQFLDLLAVHFVPPPCSNAL